MEGLRNRNDELEDENATLVSNQRDIFNDEVLAFRL